jgi:hypothetical protein
MVSHLFFYQLVLVGLLWLCCMLHYAWPSSHVADLQRLSQPLPPSRKRPRVPKPFPGLTRKPHCEACAQAAVPRPQAPCAPPPRIVSTRGRPRQVDTSSHFCPQPHCAYRGWVGLGNLRANGHPSGGPWRQFYCTACEGYVQETHGTPFHGKRVAPEKLVWAVGALAEGLGIRAVARVFEVDPNTVLAWLVEVADHAAAFSQYFLHDLRVTQVQLDELFALLSAVKTGEVSEAAAVERLSRSPHWVWTAIDPVTKLLLTVDVGDRTLAMAQRVVHQVVQVLAPDLGAAVCDRWLQGVHNGPADALWAVGAARTASGHRASAQAPLDAYAAVALCAGSQDGTAPALGGRDAPRGVWFPGGHQAGAGPPWGAHQYSLRGAAQPHHPAACRRGRTPGQHAVQGRGWVAAAVGLVSGLL